MGMMGSVLVDFGKIPKMEATTNVTDQLSISSKSKAEAWIMAEYTADNTIKDHIFAGVALRFICGIPVEGVGFEIHVVSLAGAATGTFRLCYVWN